MAVDQKDAILEFVPLRVLVLFETEKQLDVVTNRSQTHVLTTVPSLQLHSDSTDSAFMNRRRVHTACHVH